MVYFCQHSQKPFLKGPTRWPFGGFLGFWALLSYQIFLFERAVVSLLVDLAYQLNFYFDFPVL